ncbi:MAG: CBS domain-containing protein [Halobacteriales archaeon]
MLTGSHHPPETVLGTATEKDVPVMLANTDTLATIDRAEEVVRSGRTRDERTVTRMRERLVEHSTIEQHLKADSTENPQLLSDQPCCRIDRRRISTHRLSTVDHLQGALVVDRAKGYVETPMAIIDLARTEVVTVSPTTSIDDVGAILRDEDVGSVVVIEDNRPVGIVTDRDLAVNVLAEGHSPEGMTAEDVMTADLFTIDADAGIYETLRAAADANVRRIPVTEGDELVGIVTLDDIIVLLANEFAEVADIIQAESPPY